MIPYRATSYSKSYHRIAFRWLSKYTVQKFHLFRYPLPGPENSLSMHHMISHPNELLITDFSGAFLLVHRNMWYHIIVYTMHHRITHHSRLSRILSRWFSFIEFSAAMITLVHRNMWYRMPVISNAGDIISCHITVYPIYLFYIILQAHEDKTNKNKIDTWHDRSKVL